MEYDTFGEQLSAARTHTSALRSQASGLATLPPLLQETFTELQATLEELSVAQEELQTQNDELEASRLLLETERQRYQNLFDVAPEAYFVTDLYGLIREANAAASSLLAVSVRFLKGKPLANFVAADKRSEFRQELLKLPGAASGPTRLRLALTPREGRAVAAQAGVTRAVGAAGAQPSLLWVVSDLTERTEAEQVRAALAREQAARAEAERQERGLRAESALLETLLTTAPAGFAFVGTDGRFLRVNAALAQIVGIPPDDFLGKSVAEVLGETNRRLLQPLFEQATQGDVGPDTEIASPQSDGSIRHLLVSHYAVKTEEAFLGVGLVVIDITERKASEAALQSAYEKEHRIAEVLQRSLLRSMPDDTFRDFSVATFYEAALAEAQVGGDFFDVFALDGESVAFVVGDVSGKGLTAAASTAEIKYALRAFARQTTIPMSALSMLNDFMCEARQHGDWADSTFAVLSLFVIDLATGVGHLALAGAEPTLVRRASGRIETVEPHGLLLGIEPGQEYTQVEIALQPGDMLLLVTDGITEARRGHEFFGMDGLADLLRETEPQSTARHMGEEILRGVHRFVSAPEGSGSLHDDACVLVVQRQTGAHLDD